jgi:hypothetical protein
MTTKIKSYQIENDGWTPFLGTMPVFVSTTNGVDTLTLTDADDFLSTGAKVEITSAAGTHMYYLLFADATGFELVGETSPSGTITAMRYSYADCPFGFKKGEDWFKASIYLGTTQTLADAADADPVEYDTILFDTNSDWDAGNFKWVAPVSGYYLLNVKTRIADANVGIQQATPNIWDDTGDTLISGAISYKVTGNRSSEGSVVSGLLYVNRGVGLYVKASIAVSGVDTGLSVTQNKQQTYFNVQFTGI